MTRTTLDHPLVRAYLRNLSAACIALPPTQAREIHEQIAAHLYETLPPDADYAAVRTELAKLGTPRALAAEASGTVPPSAGRRFRIRLSRVRWWVWTAIALAIAAIATVPGYLIVVNRVPPLFQEGISAWYFPQDAQRSVTTTAGASTQEAVPERYHQQQGFVIGIFNDTDWTQTILGLDPNIDQAHMAFPMSIAIGTGPGAAHDSWIPQEPIRWILPADIPPHSSRVLRVLWTSNFCLAPAVTEWFPSLTLQVRIGLVTKNETIPLDVNWAMTGPSHC
jgi:hypothetical protein